MQIYRIVSPILESNCYVISQSGRAIVIDPAVCEEAYSLLNKLVIDYVILTHEHYDHIWGVNDYKQRYGCEVWCSTMAADGLENPSKNMSRYIASMAELMSFKYDINAFSNCEYVCSAEHTFSDRQAFAWQQHRITIKETPAHSTGSICVLFDDDLLFSGDTLLKDHPIQTRFPGGSSREYKNTTMPWITTLPPNTTVYPGHLEQFQLSSKNY